MGNDTKEVLGSIVQQRKGGSPFTSKSMLLAGALFLGSLGYWIAGPDKGATASWLSPAARATMALTGSYLGGYFIGWSARRAMKLTSLVAGIALAVIGLFVTWGLDGSTAESVVNSSTAWVGKNVEGAGRYLVALLPSATAAGVGGVLGFRRK
ncbi:MAG TPA: hypothetical protein DEH27_00465 [Deltaproteobacteria bacterium]|nr:hypothetical protein [Deltaproteobacteria bacterium]